MPTPIHSDVLAPARGYSNGLLYPPGSVLFVAGQIGWDKENKIVSEELVAQFEQALANVLEVVTKAGGSPQHIGRMTIYVTDKRDYLAKQREFGAVYRAQMGDHYPAMSLVQVADLLEEGAKIEIEATAVIA